MSASGWLRLSGWVAFLGGGIFFFAAGGTLLDRRNLLPWAGFFVMLAGLILTSASGLVATLARMKKLRRGIDPDDESSPPSPPAPPG